MYRPQGGRHIRAVVMSAYPIAAPRSHGASASTPDSSPSPNHESEIAHHMTSS